ncbi:hypothetical protein FQN57_001512 [Myotisia sp. PD_48]|nr:hypothetical protein FQN57_001512 [Myotisia sp. PD_48]
MVVGLAAALPREANSLGKRYCVDQLIYPSASFRWELDTLSYYLYTRVGQFADAQFSLVLNRDLFYLLRFYRRREIRRIRAQAQEALVMENPAEAILEHLRNIRRIFSQEELQTLFPAMEYRAWLETKTGLNSDHPVGTQVKISGPIVESVDITDLNMNAKHSVLHTTETIPMAIKPQEAKQLANGELVTEPEPELKLELGDCCAVCLTQFDECSIIRVLTCTHFFHISCIDQWLTFHDTFCPVCKSDLMPKYIPGE